MVEENICSIQHTGRDAGHTIAERHHGKVLNLESGPAGYTAAIHAAQVASGPLLVTSMEFGGPMSISTDFKNVPGFAEVIQFSMAEPIRC